jgi:hypothetical protein
VHAGKKKKRGSGPGENEIGLRRLKAIKKIMFLVFIIVSILIQTNSI